jgi:hypothetical protein
MKDPFEKIADEWDRDDGLTEYFGETKQELAERLGRESQNGKAEVRNALTATLVRAWNPPPLVEINQSELKGNYLSVARPLTHFADFNKVISLDWIVKGIFARGHNSYTFGPPGCGKSSRHTWGPGPSGTASRLSKSPQRSISHLSAAHSFKSEYGQNANARDLA